GLISSSFLWQVVVAAVFAAPLAWWGMQQWLNNFAYRIDLQPWVFVLVGAIACADGSGRSTKECHRGRRIERYALGGSTIAQGARTRGPVDRKGGVGADCLF
ncbi:MAG: hypothetical protein AAFP98_05665, partial [Pseudomonadota bacterium]